MNNALYISYDGLTEPLGKSQILPYLKGLSAKGISFTLLTFDKKAYLKNSNALDSLKKGLRRHNIRWISLRYHKTPSVLATAFDVLIGAIVTTFVIFEKNIKIVHCRSYVSMLMALPVCKLFHRKIIFDMRGLWPEERVEGGIWKDGSLVYRISKYFEKRFILYADRIVVLTVSMEHLLQNLFAGIMSKVKIDVIPTCVDLEKFELKTPQSKEITFVYSGSTGTVYLIKEVLSFFNAAHRIIPDSHLLILSHCDKEPILNEAARLNISSYVCIKGVEYEDLPSWLSTSTIGVAFYKPAYSASGRSPTKLWEYLACGLPVVINKGVGDTEKILAENNIGVIIEGFTERDYNYAVNRLTSLLNDKDLRSRCRRVVSGYSSLAVGIDKYSGIYNELLLSARKGYG